MCMMFKVCFGCFRENANVEVLITYSQLVGSGDVVGRDGEDG